MSDTNQKQLGNTLWSIADPLRGAMDADDFREVGFRLVSICDALLHKLKNHPKKNHQS
jgi:type I restriction-modification system DNA methylase subunit